MEREVKRHGISEIGKSNWNRKKDEATGNYTIEGIEARDNYLIDITANSTLHEVARNLEFGGMQIGKDVMLSVAPRYDVSENIFK